MTNSTTQIAFVNNTGSSNAYAYVTGRDISRNGEYAFMKADKKSFYYPESPSQPQQPLAVDCAIPMGAPGTTTTVTIPRLAGGRIWFAVGSKLAFLLNPGPGIVEPAVTNPNDVNDKLDWGFFNEVQLFVNISYVDFVSLPIALELRNTAGKTQTVKGLTADGLDRICAQLTQQGASENPGWAKLVIKGPNGKNLRALSPNSARVADPNIFLNYYKPYVDAAWQKYSTTDLHIDTQAQWGIVKGRVNPNTNLLTFPNIGTFGKPSAIDIFSCSTGVFGSYPLETREAMGAIGARLGAALNRSTLISSSLQPYDVGHDAARQYYQGSPTNHYARIVHAANVDGRGYAFPYDDVVASDDTAPDQAGTVFDGAPELLTVTVGGWRGAREVAGEDGGEGVVGKNKNENKKKSGIDFLGFFKRVMAVLKGMIRK